MTVNKSLSNFDMGIKKVLVMLLNQHCIYGNDRVLLLTQKLYIKKDQCNSQAFLLIPLFLQNHFSNQANAMTTTLPESTNFRILNVVSGNKKTKFQS